MTDNEITNASAPTDPQQATAPPASGGGDAGAPRPGFIPEKFWDADGGRVRVEELAKSYRALERRLGGGLDRAAPAESVPPKGHVPGAPPTSPSEEPAVPGSPEQAPAGNDAATTVPESPEEYAVAVSHPWLARDGEIDNLLHAAGFNQEQAQLVYDLAAERVVPVIEQMAAEFERRLAQAKLESHFGGPERFAGIARQVRAWGERHLPKSLYETLAASPDGVAALHHMMRSGEPRFAAGGEPAGAPSQGDLEALVRDPRYWRDHDPQLVKRVEDGFRRLYPGD